MLTNDKRYCDLCEREIHNGERYIAAQIDRDLVPPNANIAGIGLTVDEMGNVHIHLCMNCRIGKSLVGEELIC